MRGGGQRGNCSSQFLACGSVHNHASTCLFSSPAKHASSCIVLSTEFLFVRYNAREGMEGSKICKYYHFVSIFQRGRFCCKTLHGFLCLVAMQHSFSLNWVFSEENYVSQNSDFGSLFLVRSVSFLLFDQYEKCCIIILSYCVLHSCTAWNLGSNDRKG